MAKVRDLVKEHNNCIFYRAIAQNLDLNRNTAYRFLIEKLHLKAVCSRWIPHRLTENHKTQRVEEAQNRIVNLSGSTIVVDEKWLFADLLPARPHCSSYIGPDADHPHKISHYCGMRLQGKFSV